MSPGNANTVNVLVSVLAYPIAAVLSGNIIWICPWEIQHDRFCVRPVPTNVMTASCPSESPHPQSKHKAENSFCWSWWSGKGQGWGWGDPPFINLMTSCFFRACVSRQTHIMKALLVLLERCPHTIFHVVMLFHKGLPTLAHTLNRIFSNFSYPCCRPFEATPERKLESDENFLCCLHVALATNKSCRTCIALPMDALIYSGRALCNSRMLTET